MAPTTKTKWSAVEEAAVIACADHCVQKKLSFNPDITDLMKDMNFPRTWSQISSKLSCLNKAHNRTSKKNSLVDLRKDGMNCLHLPADLAAQVEIACKTLQELSAKADTGTYTADDMDAVQESVSAAAENVNAMISKKRSREPDADHEPVKESSRKRSREPDDTTNNVEHSSKRAKSDYSLDIANMDRSEVMEVDESQVLTSEEQQALGMRPRQTLKPFRRTSARNRSMSPYQTRRQLKESQLETKVTPDECKELEELRLKTAEQEGELAQLRKELEDTRARLRSNGAKLLEMGQIMVD
ncbi:hypothetical protein BDV96DRAFT_642254 [Lophiotrema nucula]|uniref:Uncharacterized protein n=1 Tax=Lophiotrema nucula TaxID=690887 RepID=A0A6A5ZJA3_9PLEO|nr:hypothetical protein BDV96DRAFT_642254 [Lophiotrema nucula]